MRNGQKLLWYGFSNWEKNVFAETGKLSGAGRLFRESTFGHGGLGVFGLEMYNKQVRIRFCSLGEGSGISIET